MVITPVLILQASKVFSRLTARTQPGFPGWVFCFRACYYLYMNYIMSSVNSFRSLVRGEHIFAVIAFMLFFIPVSTSPVGGVYVEVVKHSLLFFGLGLLLFQFRKARDWSLPQNPILWFLVVLLCLSTLLAMDPWRAFLGYYSRYNNFAILYFSVFTLVFVVRSFGLQRQKNLALIGVLAAFVVALFGIVQSLGVAYYGGIQSLIAAAPSRVPSFLGNPNFASLFVAMFLPVAGYFLISSSGRKKIFLAFICVTMSWGLSVFASRGAILAALVGMAILGVSLLVRRAWINFLYVLLLALFCLGISMASLAVYRENGQQFFKAEDTSAVDRYIAWTSASNILEQHPLVGVGLGNYQNYYWKNWIYGASNVKYFFDDAHNLVLTTAATAGLPFALVLFTLLGYTIIFVGSRALKRSDFFVISTVSGLVVMLVGSLVNPIVISLWLAAAVLFGISSQYLHIKSSALSVGVWGSRAVTMLGLVFIVFGAAAFSSEHLLVFAQKKLDKGDYQEVVRYARLAALTNPLSTQARNLAALGYIRLGNTASADVAIEKALNLEPSSPFNYLTCANLYQEAYLWSRQDLTLAVKADKCFQIALEINRSHPDFELQYASFLITTNRVEEASGYIKRGLAGVSKDPKSWLLLARYYQETERLPQLLFALNQARKLSPGFKVLSGMIAILEDTKDVHSINLGLRATNPIQYYR